MDLVSEKCANERGSGGHPWTMLPFLGAPNTLVSTAEGLELLAYLLERVVQPAQDSCLS
jgi:hypothetical protein